MRSEEDSEISIPVDHEYQMFAVPTKKAGLARQRPELDLNNGPNPKPVKSAQGLPGSKRSRPISAANGARRKPHKDFHGRPVLQVQEPSVTPFTAY